MSRAIRAYPSVADQQGHDRHLAVDYPTSMIDAERLERIRRASRDGDWAPAGEAYVDLSLAARGSADLFRVEAIAPYVRLRDAESIAAIIDELLARAREE